MATTDTSDYTQVLSYLQGEANDLLEASLGSQPLCDFEVGALGLFPYYYQNPNNPQQFNSATWNWLNANLVNNIPPIIQQSGTTFTNLFLQALTNIQFTLSAADTAQLNKAYNDAQAQQTALINAWYSTYNSYPVGTGTPIDNVMGTIATTWAIPATNLNAMQNAISLSTLLNNAPASGQTLFPLVSSYLNALGSSVSLSNLQTMNNSYLTKAINALESPSTANGGIVVDGQGGAALNGKILPAYSVNTPLNNIQNAITQNASDVSISMSISASEDSDYSVSISGGTKFKIKADFLTIGVSANANYFHDDVVQNSSSCIVNMTFPGVNLVNFGPPTFNESAQLYWYYMTPILNAIANDNLDVSSYKWISPSSYPGNVQDFGTNGNFGILQGIAISNFPSIEMTVTSSDYESIATTFQQSVSTTVSFCGIKIGGGTESTYSSDVKTDSSSSSVTIKLGPPVNTMGGTIEASVGYILGVVTNFPAA